VEIASGLFLGDRTFQQDAIETWQHPPSGKWLLALSDGIGGAGNGHLASRLIVRSAMANLKAHVGDIATGAAISEILLGAAQAANRSISSAVARHPDKAGMGGTLLLACLSRNMLHYLSIGDSLIFRLRGGKISTLNALHSLAGGVDALAATGRFDASTARSAAMRSTLTSALTGQTLTKIDAPAKGIALSTGDALMMASDGIETLPETALVEALSDGRQKGAAQVAADVIDCVKAAAVPHQDNVSLIIATM
jgi:serine/threonine protein phosphatase PrpC